MNKNSNYMRSPNLEKSNMNYNNYIYGKGSSYFNRDKNNFDNFYGKSKNSDNEILSKPIFTNSKLENNGNPEGNFLKIDINQEDKKQINLTNIGEIPVIDNGPNSILTIKSLLIGKEPEKKENIINEEKILNKNEFLLSNDSHNNNNLNDDKISLPWRSGSNQEAKGGGYNNYNKAYRNNKKESFYYNNGKNYNKNRYSLNQPQPKKSNKFD